jgi:hypothetical protein
MPRRSAHRRPVLGRYRASSSSPGTARTRGTSRESHRSPPPTVCGSRRPIRPAGRSCDGLGFLNPLLYADAQAQHTFNDITSGNNGSYSAAVGWDPCTGWGSPNGDALLQVLANWNFAQWQTGAR